MPNNARMSEKGRSLKELPQEQRGDHQIRNIGELVDKHLTLGRL